MRASGDPYLQHCVETAVSLALIGANSTVVAAGLLHDALDDSSVTYNHIRRTFGDDVADLVKGVRDCPRACSASKYSIEIRIIIAYQNFMLFLPKVHKHHHNILHIYT